MLIGSTVLLFLIAFTRLRSAGLLALALICQAVLLHQRIDIHGLQNLNFFNCTSFILWLACLVSLLLRKRYFGDLNLILIPLNILFLLIAYFSPVDRLIAADATSGRLIHILLALIASSCLFLTCVQAILVYLQQYCLKHKVFPTIIHRLPPLQNMERGLLFLLMSTFILMTVVIAQSVWALPLTPNFYQRPQFLLTLLDWLLFAVLVIGKMRHYWRNRTVLRGVCIGLILILILLYLIH